MGHRRPRPPRFRRARRVPRRPTTTSAGSLPSGMPLTPPARCRAPSSAPPSADARRRPRGVPTGGGPPPSPSSPRSASSPTTTRASTCLPCPRPNGWGTCSPKACRAVRRALRASRTGRRTCRPLPQRRRCGQLAVATRRPRSGPPPSSRRLPGAGPVGGTGRAVAGHDRGAWAVAAGTVEVVAGAGICSNGTRPARSAVVSSNSWDLDDDRSQRGLS